MVDNIKEYKARGQMARKKKDDYEEAFPVTVANAIGQALYDYAMPREGEDRKSYTKRMITDQWVGLLNGALEAYVGKPAESMPISVYMSPAGTPLSASDAVAYAKEKEWGMSMLSAVGAIPYVPSFAGIVAGYRAANANKKLLNKAKKMDKRAMSRDEIYAETGFWKGPDGKWRWEIDDSTAQWKDGDVQAIRKRMATGKPEEVMLGEILDHPYLYDAYPRMRTMKVKFDPTMKPGQEGAYVFPSKDNNGQEYIMINSFSLLNDPQEAFKSIMHEANHAVAWREMFGRGGNAAEFAKAEIRYADKMSRVKNLLDHPKVRELLQAQKTGGTGAAREWGEKNAATWEQITEQLHKDGFRSLSEARMTYSEFLNNPKKYTKEGMYRRLIGEGESFAVEDRLWMSEIDRILSPFYKNKNIPQGEDVIIKAWDGADYPFDAFLKEIDQTEEIVKRKGTDLVSRGNDLLRRANQSPKESGLSAAEAKAMREEGQALINRGFEIEEFATPKNNLSPKREQEISNKLRERYQKENAILKDIDTATKEVEIGIANKKKEIGKWHEQQKDYDTMVEEFTKNPPKKKTRAEVETERKKMASGSLKDMMGRNEKKFAGSNVEDLFSGKNFADVSQGEKNAAELNRWLNNQKATYSQNKRLALDHIKTRKNVLAPGTRIRDISGEREFTIEGYTSAMRQGKRRYYYEVSNKYDSGAVDIEKTTTEYISNLEKNPDNYIIIGSKPKLVSDKNKLEKIQK